MARARGRFVRGIMMAEPDHLRTGNNDSRTEGSGIGREKRAPNQEPMGQQHTSLFFASFFDFLPLRVRLRHARAPVRARRFACNQLSTFTLDTYGLEIRGRYYCIAFLGGAMRQSSAPSFASLFLTLRCLVGMIPLAV